MFPMIRMNRSYPINIENKTRRLIIDVPYKMLDINAGMIPTAYIVWDIRDVFLFVNVLVSTIPSDYHWVKLLTTYDAFLNQLSCESLYLSDYVYYILGNVYLKRISTYYNVLVFKYSFIYILLFLKVQLFLFGINKCRLPLLDLIWIEVRVSFWKKVSSLH